MLQRLSLAICLLFFSLTTTQAQILSASAINGVVDVSAGKIKYTPNKDFYGTDIITYVIRDNLGESSSTTVEVTVRPVNDAPAATNFIQTILEDSNPRLIDFQAHASDIDNTQLSIQANISGINGSLTNASSLNPKFYTPKKDWNGTEVINYTASDGNKSSTSATATIVVLPVDDNPTAVNDSFVINLTGTSHTFDLANNDFDIDNDNAIINITNANVLSGSGSVSITSPTDVLYNPGSSPVNSVLEYSIKSNGKSANGHANIQVNYAPIVTPDSLTMQSHKPLRMTLSSNDTDLEDNIKITNPPATLFSNFKYADIESSASEYIFDQNKIDHQAGDTYPLTDTAQYTIKDSNGFESLPGTVTITINESQDDPNYSSKAWHINPYPASYSSSLHNETIDIHTLKNRYLGDNIVIGIIDQGVAIEHPDLIDNVIHNGSVNFLDGTSNTSTGNTHGTMVAGTSSSVGWNGIGSRGVAPESKIRSFNWMDPGAGTSANLVRALGADDKAKDVSVFNQSFIYTSQVSYPSTIRTDALRAGVQNGRNGLGHLYVKSAGNSFVLKPNDQPCSKPAWKSHLTCATTTQDPFSNHMEQIIVAALYKNSKASFSSPGPTIWITAPGRDIQSTTGLNSYTPWSGTSASAPVVSGAIALILQANPMLGWRDVKHIMAKTATKINPTITPVTMNINGEDHIAVDGWIENGAGNSFHNYYGFGRVNVADAINMAKNYDTNLPDYTELTVDISSASDITDNSKTGTEKVLTITADTINKIESVTLGVLLTHENVGDLTMELTSPSGTKNIVLMVNSDLEGVTVIGSPTNFLTNAFYGETATGDWTLKIIDTAPGNTGKIFSARLRITGT